MKQNAMLVFDRDKSIIKRLRKLSPKPNEKWILFPLFYEEEIVKKIESYLESQGCLIEKIQLQKEISETAFSLRNKYIHFIYEIGKKRLNGSKSVKSWLKYPFRNYSLWWSSLVAEKNTMKSAAFHNFIKAYSILSRIKKRKIGTVFLNLSNREVFNSLIEWGRSNDIKFMKRLVGKNHDYINNGYNRFSWHCACRRK